MNKKKKNPQSSVETNRDPVFVRVSNSETQHPSWQDAPGCGGPTPFIRFISLVFYRAVNETDGTPIRYIINITPAADEPFPFMLC